MPQQRSLRMRCRPRRRKVSSRRPLSPVPSRPRLQRSRTRRARTHDSTRRARCAFISRHLPLFGANDVSNIGSEQFDSRTSENRGASSNRDPSTSRNTTKPSLDLGHHQNSCRNRWLLQPLCHPRPLQQVRCGMETFTHRIRRVRRDVCHGNNSHARRRFGWLVHSRRPRRAFANSTHSTACAGPFLERAPTERFVRGRPLAPSLPDQIWINRPESPEQIPTKLVTQFSVS